MKKSVDELKETMKSDKKELKDKVFMSCSNFELSLTMVAKFREGIEGQGIHGLFKEFNISIEHGIEGTFMFLYKMKPILVLSFIVFLQIENEYTDIKRRVELETNEIRDKQQVRRSYT